MKDSFCFRWFCVTLLCLMAQGAALAKMKVATLHPLMTDLAREVGGDDVEVTQLIANHANPHQFSPTPKILAKAQGAKIYLASGKNLENYLTKLRTTLGDSAIVIEVGNQIPSQKISGRDAYFICCPSEAHDVVDPHWWHNVNHMKKAARLVAKEFSKIDPNNTDRYKSRAAAYGKKLTRLDAWIKRQVSKIPREQRILATAHAAYGYFCKEYGFKSLPVKGLSANHKTSATYQAETIRAIRKHGVKAVFPEHRTNPKALQVIATETGVVLGGTIVADGVDNYERMMRGNVSIIVKALTR